MRKVIFAMNVSIDGCYEHTNFSPDVELMEFFTQLMQGTDLDVYGRKTYELMFPYWADVAKDKSSTKADREFAQAMTAIDKIVFSRTLDSAYENTRIVRANLEDEILKLKQQPGKKISIGSVTLFRQLMELDLIDEIHLVVHPIIVGEGKRLWDDVDISERLNFKLLESKIFKSGCVGLHYAK